MIRPCTIVLLPAVALVLSCGLVTPCAAQQFEDRFGDLSQEMVELLEEMRTTCQQLVDLRTEEFRSGVTGLREVIGAQDRLVGIELQLARTVEDRKAALEQKLKLAQDLEDHVAAQFAAGVTPQSDLLDCRLRRMNTELLILKEDH